MYTTSISRSRITRWKKIAIRRPRDNRLINTCSAYCTRVQTTVVQFCRSDDFQTNQVNFIEGETGWIFSRGNILVFKVGRRRTWRVRGQLCSSVNFRSLSQAAVRKNLLSCLSSGEHRYGCTVERVKI